MTAGSEAGLPVVTRALAGPGIRRQRLGAELRRLREDRCLRLEDVAARLGVATSTVSRIESGLAPTRTSYLAVMLDLYGLDDPAQRAALTELARDGRRKGWWTDYADLLPAAARHYLGLEAAAARVRGYAPHTIPDLCQTPAYAAAVCRAAQPRLGPDQVRRYVTVIARRQETILGEGREVHLVVDESVLLRAIGPEAVMTGQLRHLLDVAAQPGVTIQAVPLAAPQTVLSAAFTLLCFDDPADPDLAFQHAADGKTSATDRASNVETATETFRALARLALPADRTADLIATLTGGSC